MVAIAITGGIACGKSLALNEFKKLGARCVDCDKIVREIHRKQEIKRILKKTFGTTDKKRLSKIVFSDRSKRALLESIIQPLVLEELKRLCSRYKGKKQGLLVVEAPLLFEGSIENLFDWVIVVSASKKLQIERLLKKGFSRKEALQRINAQMSIEEKVKKADFVIENNGNKRLVAKQVRDIFSKVGI